MQVAEDTGPGNFTTDKISGLTNAIIGFWKSQIQF